MTDDAEIRGRRTDDRGQGTGAEERGGDARLLRRYAEEGAEDAFAELVRRHIDFTYGAALRLARGNAALAQDVTQAVFTDLARKAGTLSRHEVLVGWLHTATRFATAKAIRAESRRHLREQEAHAMNEAARGGEQAAMADWERLRPVIDEVLGELKERERAAILLRFFEDRPLAEVGAKLALSESAARSCVDRALDKLHALLARRGVTSTSTALGVALANHVAVAAPAGLAASATAAALAGSAAGVVAGGGGAWVTFMSMTKLQLGIAGAVAVAGATGYVVQGQTNAELRREIAVVREQQASVAALRTENQRLAGVAAEVEALRRDDVELKQLEQSVAEVKRVSQERARLAQAQARVQDRRKVLEAQLQEKDRQAQAEVDRLNKEGNALVVEYKAMSAGTKNTELTPDGRAELEVAVKAKMAEIKAKQHELQEFHKARREELRQSPEFVELRGLPPEPGLSDSAPATPGLWVTKKSMELKRVPADSQDAGNSTSVPGTISPGPGSFKFVPGPKPAPQP